MIVGDIVRQYRVVEDLQRLSMISRIAQARPIRTRRVGASQAELVPRNKTDVVHRKLKRLGVEFKNLVCAILQHQDGRGSLLAAW